MYPGDDATLYIDTTKPLLIVGLNLLIILSLNLNTYRKATIDCGFAFVNIESLNLNFIAGYFLVGVGFLGPGGPGVWFLNDSISCPEQLSLKITFLV